LGNVARSDLAGLWTGVRRSELRRRLQAHDFTAGCSGCGAAIEIEGRANSYPALFDSWAPRSKALQGDSWPRRMEFNLSNACNLQCVQCDGELSSAIRTHREHRSPMIRPYGDAFFDQLAEFIPHVEWTQFAGGEPFLARENYRVWDLIERLNPDLRCHVITNATQWSERIEHTAASLRMSFAFSVDAASETTFESIRVGAAHSQVLANIDRFREVAARNDMPTSINHCLMRQNYHEFGELLIWAEERAMPVDVSVVRTPAHSSIAHLGHEQLEQVCTFLDDQADRVRPRLDLNLAVWDAEVARIALWADATMESSQRVWIQPRRDRILEFPSDGAGPGDDSEALRQLEHFATDGIVHRLIIGSDNHVESVGSTMDAVARFDPGPLVGLHVEHLPAALAAVFGPVGAQEIRSQTDDRLEVWTSCGPSTIRTIMVPLRNSDGWAERAALLFAIGPSSSDS